MTTLSDLQTDLAAYRTARTRILASQEYWIGSRKLRFADLAVVEKTIRELEMRIAMLQDNAGLVKTSHAVFGS